MGRQVSLFLTSDELHELTGYKVGHYQAHWLMTHGYPYEKTISGKPRVLRAFVEKRLGLAVTDYLPKTAPNFSYWKHSEVA